MRRFVCHLYGFEGLEDVRDVRFQLFREGKCDEELLPPNDDSLEQHIGLLRANYQCYIWRHASHPISNLPSCEHFGWSFSTDGKVVVRWMTLPPASDSVLSFISCKCKMGCQSLECSCKKAALFCTDICGSSDCRNGKNEEIYDCNVEDIYDSEEYTASDGSDSEVDC